MQQWEDLVERRIREAMESGEFDDLPGQGRPQDLGANPYEAPELALAHRMLKNAGMAPAWIEERNQILAEIERARRRLDRTGDREEFAAEVRRLDERILSNRLKAPAGVRSLAPLSLTVELERAAARAR